MHSLKMRAKIASEIGPVAFLDRKHVAVTHPKSRTFGGILWRVDRDLYMVTPKYANGFINDLEKVCSSRMCYVCSSRVQCIAATAAAVNTCSRRLDNIYIKGRSVVLDRFLTTSLFDKYDILRFYQYKPYRQIIDEYGPTIKELFRQVGGREVAPSECRQCFLFNSCSQNYRLRALIKKCSRMDFGWVKERLLGNTQVAVLKNMGDTYYVDPRRLYDIWNGWSVIGYLIYRPVWISRKRESVLGIRLMHDDFLKSAKIDPEDLENGGNRVLAHYAREVRTIAYNCRFKRVENESDCLFALRALARQARMMCVLSERYVGGNLGPFAAGDSVGDILREVSYYWPIIKLALEHGCDVYDLCHLH